MNIGDKIRELRTRKGFSQENMAESLGMSVANYSYIESGKVNLTIPKLEDIAKILETDIFEILSLGEKSVYYIHNQQQKGGNGFIVTNQIPFEYQSLCHELEKLRMENAFLKKEVLSLQEINSLLKKQDKEQC